MGFPLTPEEQWDGRQEWLSLCEAFVTVDLGTGRGADLPLHRKGGWGRWQKLVSDKLLSRATLFPEPRDTLGKTGTMRVLVSCLRA